MGDAEDNSNNVPGDVVEDWPLFNCGAHDLREELLASDNQYKSARANISAVLEQSRLRTKQDHGSRSDPRRGPCGLAQAGPKDLDGTS